MLVINLKHVIVFFKWKLVIPVDLLKNWMKKLRELRLSAKSLMPCLKFARKEKLHKKVPAELLANKSLISWYVWIKKGWAIHPSSAALSEQSKQSGPNSPLSEHFSEHHLVGSQGVPRAAERCSPSSMSWVVLWVSYHWDMPGTLPQGSV